MYYIVGTICSNVIQRLYTNFILLTPVVSISISPMEYQVSEAEKLVNIGVLFGETQTQVVVGLTTVPDTASG